MTSRIGSPDTLADLEVRECLSEARSFVMVAGAGSGKTTSLIKALTHLGETRGAALRRAGQQIACITFTEVAVGEISHDVGVSSLFHVSTIHSFLWSISRPFQSDIAAWVVARIDEKIGERQGRHATPRQAWHARRDEGATRAGDCRSQSRARGDRAGREVHLRDRQPTGRRHPRARRHLAADAGLRRRAPAAAPGRRPPISYIFVDESQDTQPAVIKALRQIAGEEPLCVGFFGASMQKIYGAGAERSP